MELVHNAMPDQSGSLTSAISRPPKEGGLKGLPSSPPLVRPPIGATVPPPTPGGDCHQVTVPPLGGGGEHHPRAANSSITQLKFFSGACDFLLISYCPWPKRRPPPLGVGARQGGGLDTGEGGGAMCRCSIRRVSQSGKDSHIDIITAVVGSPRQRSLGWRLG